MQNKKDDAFSDDEFIEDDLDFEDLDEVADDLDVLDEDLADDDDWDVLDDEDESSKDDSSSGKSKDSRETAAPGFLKKYFSLIVVAIALLGGGLVFLGFMGQKAASVRAPVDEAPAQDVAVSQPQDQAGQEAGLPSEDAAPSMSQDMLATPPAPMEAGVAATSEDGMLSDSAAFDLDRASSGEDEVLTPMPELSQDGEGQMSDALPSLDDTLDGLTESAQVQEVAQADVSEEPDVVEVPKADEVSVDLGVSAAQDDQRVADLERLNADLSSQIEAKDNDLREERERVSALQKAVSGLEDEVRRLQGLLQESKEAASVVSEQKEEPVKASEASETASADVKAVPTQAESKAQLVSTPQWVLRSAQPGRAVLAQKETGDFKTVEVGDHVAGLGRIRSIQVENGRWVVRGSSGSVSQ